jgi:hypothetical protein
MENDPLSDELPIADIARDPTHPANEQAQTFSSDLATNVMIIAQIVYCFFQGNLSEKDFEDFRNNHLLVNEKQKILHRYENEKA